MTDLYTNAIVETCLGTTCPNTVDAARRIFDAYDLEQPTNCDALDSVMKAKVGVDSHKTRIRIKRLLNSMDMTSPKTLDKLSKIEEMLS